ncbi:accessory factor UbiK family protein [Candidatus Liberibacter asiaticus]|uniref:Uncharacterized protein n=2 Tax=Liberibacter asiaticus TaxID=34021 RepID=C6XHZ2_LIBAP|nr:accessory factor UbiK family protein [Candidatus Liberibacter asiaticus]ACT56885.1 hypothetical protein CLIBASIA_01485 [Candidatus Liberibacter asiaticus str. psy62]AGH16649.1 hypothetical protein WSI_01395 [Candidatus Liberibacter asiaticus str. gxpsy]ALK07035.1 accessory factor UbiK family protein [Candidatus Liberibacter asiaticus]ASK52505.1 hypothetical protein B2I23_01425 [Candidatus Liberibacter asiaticus]AWL13830.1 hypothetical protein DIC79_01450 [Candidatus Liberibacter asiaticus]
MSFRSNQFFQQASRLASCASDAFKDISKEAESFAQIKIQRTLNSMGVVRAEEIENVKRTTSHLREEITAIGKRLEKIEQQLADLELFINQKEKE